MAVEWHKHITSCKSFPSGGIIINADSSQSKSRQRLAARTINDRAAGECVLQTTQPFAGRFLARHHSADVVLMKGVGRCRREMRLRYQGNGEDQKRGRQGAVRAAGPEEMWAGAGRLEGH